MAVDLALAKAHCRVTHTGENTIIQQYVDAAALLVEKMSGNLLTRREVTQRFDAFCSRLPLFWGPDPDTVTVDYTDTDDVPQTIADAMVVRDWLYPNADGWPSIATDTVIEVTYTAGWAETPADLMSAQLLLIGHWYANREAVNVGDTIAELPMAVDALVQPYRKIMV
jgi:uncharacterized phiE125 gp8 family phage protein